MQPGCGDPRFTAACCDPVPTGLPHPLWISFLFPPRYKSPEVV